MAGPRQQVARTAALMLRPGRSLGIRPDPPPPAASPARTRPARPQHLTAVCVERTTSEKATARPRSPATTLEEHSEAVRKAAG